MADHTIHTSLQSVTAANTLTPAGDSLILSLEETVAVRENAQISAFFRRSVLKAILAHPQCRGIRIYPDFGNDENVLLKIVGGRGPFQPDLRGGIAGRFHPQDDLRFADEETETRLRKMTAEEDFLLRKAYFSSTDIDYLLRDDADGIRFYSSQLQYGDLNEPVNTMTAIAERVDGGEMQAISSALPCPPHCGGGNYTGDDGWA